MNEFSDFSIFGGWIAMIEIEYKWISNTAIYTPADGENL
jgi:hypothetical protein